MIILHYPKCSTCKKAIRFLEEKKYVFKQRDIVNQKPTEEELKKWIKISGKDIKKFFNTSGLKYRNQNLKEKTKNMTYEEKVKLLASDGMLIKRPLLIMKNKVLIGFKQDEWEENI